MKSTNKLKVCPLIILRQAHRDIKIWVMNYYSYLKGSYFLLTGFRADIAERRSYIETAHRNIHQLEEDIKVKQSTLKHYKANAKRYDN